MIWSVVRKCKYMTVIIFKKILLFFYRIFRSITCFFPVLFEFGIKMAIIQSLEYLFSHRIGYSQRIVDNTQAFLDNDLAPFVKSFKPICSTRNTLKKIVWMCWWQGVEFMPPLVSSCYDIIMKTFANSDFEVILITKDNYSDYIDIPAFLLEKYEKGVCGLAHIADVLRFGLISIYGGAWMDSTILLTSSFSLERFSSCYCLPFYTQKYDPNSDGWYQREPSRGMWSSFFFVGNPESTSFFKFIYEAQLYYWKHHNRLIQYVLLDYIMMVGYKSFLEYKLIIDDVEPNNEHVWDLHRIINQPFDKNRWEKLQINHFYKLIYRARLKEKTKKGQLTYYGYIKNNISEP